MSKKAKKSDVVIVEWHVSMGLHKAYGVWEYEREAWDAMTPAERGKELDGAMQCEIANNIDAGYSFPDGEVVE